MSTTAISSEESLVASDDQFQYRALSTSAVASLILGALSVLIFFAGQSTLLSAVMIAPLPLAGLLIGLRAIHQIRRDSDHLSGMKTARLGTGLSAICLFGGMAFAGFIYATEVPDGYTRTSFIEFAPDKVELEQGVAVPQDVVALDGKKVFFKGYIRPDSVPFERGFQEFLLVRDNNECCYGDQAKVKYHDQVAVTLVDGKKADYSGSMFRVGGVLHVLPKNALRGPGFPVFRLEADYIQ